MKQISGRIPESLKEQFYEKCDKEDAMTTVILALIVKAFVDDVYRELEEGKEEG